MALLKVFGPAHGPALWVLLLLEELGLPYVHSPEGPADSLNAQLPVLQDGELILSGSVATCLYLADKFGNLAPALNSPERGLYQQACLAVAPFEAWLVELAAGSDQARQSVLGQLQAIGPGLMQALQGRQYLVENRYTLADLLLGSCLDRLIRMGLFQPAGMLAEYLQRIISRPAFQAKTLRLSVMVFAGPEDAQSLGMCLEMLARQSFTDFEVLVIDHSATGAEVCRTFAGRLLLKRLLPVIDANRAAGFNQALAAADSQWLVCLNASTLLNPDALRSYAAYLAAPGQKLVFGYLGTSVDQTEATPEHWHAPSQWFPEHQVGFLDYRLQLYRRQALQPAPNLLKHP